MARSNSGGLRITGADRRAAKAAGGKAMSYDRMKKREAELAAEVDRWLKAAEAADAEEDKLYGDKRGDEMPDTIIMKSARSTAALAIRRDE